jgi:hypothetical protein
MTEKAQYWSQKFLSTPILGNLSAQHCISFSSEQIIIIIIIYIVIFLEIEPRTLWMGKSAHDLPLNYNPNPRPEQKFLKNYWMP